MMERYGRLLARKKVAWVFIAVTSVFIAISAFWAQKVGRDDDVLKFLPQNSPEVAAFHEISGIFGGLRVAIVGIQTDDPFDADFLARLRSLTRDLDDDPVVAHALSLGNVEDFTLDPEKGGVRIDYLVMPLPKTPEDKEALRARVMSKDHIVGQLISRDARSVIVYAFLAHDADLRAAATRVRELSESAFPEREKYWGGAPFITTYIYDVALADMKRLIPWAVAVVIVLVIASFRDFAGALLALATPGAGILITHGFMGAAHVDTNIVLSSMPVILFALGSAYSVHFMIRYYALRATRSCEDAVRLAMKDIGPIVLGAGLTTVAGLFSYATMNIQPMREFGIFAGLGNLAALILALTFTPAVVRVAELKSRIVEENMLYADTVARLVGFVRKHRRVFLVVVGVVTAAAAALTGRVEARMESAAFFSKDSPPDRAMRFLREEFGGSVFLQVNITGDMSDPAVLRELQLLADRLRLEPHVTSVTHVGQVVALVHEAWSGERRIPPKQGQIKEVYALLTGREALRQLITDDRKQALLHVKLDTDEHDALKTLLARVNEIVDKDVAHGYRIGGPKDKETNDRLRTQVLARIEAILRDYAIALPSDKRDKVAHLIEKPPTEADETAVADRVATYLKSEESLLDPELHAQAATIAQVAASMAPDPPKDVLRSAIASILKAPLPPECTDAEGENHKDKDEDVCKKAAEENAERAEQAEDVAVALRTPLAEIWQQERTRGFAKEILREAGIAQPEDKDKAARMQLAMGDALLDLDRPSVLLPAAQGDGTLTYRVNGEPVLYEALTRAVTTNQLSSLGTSLLLVLPILIFMLRSFTAGLLAAVPTTLTLLITYGIMGAVGLQLDIGTSMLASLIVGVGVDYGVHLLLAWQARDDESTDDAAKRAAHHAGPSIATDAFMVGAGFIVLTLGEAKPLRNVGALTATAILVAALTTFVALPLLARKRRYGSLYAESKPE